MNVCMFNEKRHLLIPLPLALCLFQKKLREIKGNWKRVVLIHSTRTDSNDDRKSVAVEVKHNKATKR